jgi:hypothetical protein
MEQLYVILLSLMGTFGLVSVGAALSLLTPLTSGIGLAYFHFIGLMFQNFFNFIRQLFQFLIDHLPKPIKMILFVVLFTVLGAMLYNWTIGATYVCNNPTTDEVLQVNWFQGIGVKLNPPVFSETTKVGASTGEGPATPLSGDNMSTNPNSIANIPSNCDSSGDGIFTPVERACKYETDSRDYGTVVVSDAFFGVAAQGDRMSSLNGDDYMKSKSTQIWNSFFGSDTINFHVCQDMQTGACMLDTRVYVDGFGRSLRTYSTCGMYTGAFQLDRGSIVYTNHPKTGVLDVRIYDSHESILVSVVDFVTFWSSGTVEPGLASCNTVVSGDIINSVVENTADSTNEDVYYSMFKTGSCSRDNRAACQNRIPITITVNTTGGEVIPVNLYYTQFALMAWGPVESKGVFGTNIIDQTFSDLTQQPVQPGTNIEQPSPLTSTLRDIFDNSVVVTNSPTDLIQYHCSVATSTIINGNEYEDPYTTHLEIFGVNPFDPTIMYFFVFIGLLWSFYATYAGWWR